MLGRHRDLTQHRDFDSSRNRQSPAAVSRCPRIAIPKCNRGPNSQPTNVSQVAIIIDLNLFFPGSQSPQSHLYYSPPSFPGLPKFPPVKIFPLGLRSKHRRCFSSSSIITHYSSILHTVTLSIQTQRYSIKCRCSIYFSCHPYMNEKRKHISH